ncbi:MAG: hypothetical protein GZ093_07175 [Rhodoferax sp.]|uniref:hypothetical protein n=1 Tax=Rhodoferax sp. TaxID=50421 RepID=UPI0013FF7BDF|nr:hypothetical protein [Rhodoferax sp.]NDP38519.1 hypothetical protein [Rhodoferax sp.]
MTLLNAQFFEKLRRLLPQDQQHEQPRLNRWLNTNEIEKNWLKDVKFETDEMFQFGDHYQLAIAVFANEHYIVCSGLKPELLESDFEYCEINTGLFCAAIVELNINPIISETTGLELAENIFIPIENISEKGMGYDLSIVTKYFPEISIYKIHSKSPFFSLAPALQRVGLFVVTKCSVLQSLNWSQAGLEIARVVCTLEVDIFPYELVLRAITERKWDHAFLEIYRSIEFLYPFPKINELKNKLKLSLPSEAISEIVEDVLSWRPVEEAALQGLLKNLPLNLLNEFKLAFDSEAKITGFDNKKAASLIYKLRNDCVHFRPVQKSSSLRSNVNWEILLPTMLHATHFCYGNQLISST